MGLHKTQGIVIGRRALGESDRLVDFYTRDYGRVRGVAKSARQTRSRFGSALELFTLGEGNYAERDVKEAARAFTGWGVDPDRGEFVFRPRAHDDGVKTVLGRTGNFDGDAVLGILLAQPQTAELVAAKLWREFVSPNPDPGEVRRIARVLRESDYELRPALRALLTSDAFYAPESRAVLIKSPVELVVGTLRQFSFTTGEPLPFVLGVAALGQNLFAPPNVKGWPGGEAWINSTTLLGRKALLDRLFRVEEMRAMVAEGGGVEPPKMAARMTEGRQRFLQALLEVQFDGAKWLSQFDGRPQQLERVVLASAPVSEPPQGTQGIELIRHLVLDPAYQLK